MVLVQARTLIAPSAPALLAALSRQPKLAHPLLYALSSTLPSDALPDTIKSLRGLSSSTSLGCLSAPLIVEGKEQFAASMAWFDGARCVPFRSTIPGRERAQVGRRVDARLPEDTAAFDAEAGLDRVALGDSAAWADVWAGAPPGLPKELTHIPYVSALVMFSDDAPQGLLSALKAAYPETYKMALRASSTPFVTGRPFTLLRDDEVHSSGAMGFALLKSKPSFSTGFAGLRPLSPSMKVTAAEGNLIHTLNDSNPSQLLLDAIRAAGLYGDGAKEDRFVLGVSTSAESIHERAFRITSGDPKRGTLALETDATIAENSFVQFFKSSPPTDVARPSETPSISFMTTSDVPGMPLQNSSENSMDVESVRIFDASFVAGSENGWTVAQASEEVWACSVPGASASMTW
ncbi:hypothetical protein PENSPDRAFT_97911 [Peniophora sp. CONT]|nr:hypothetical protein PENSPDRAFT_97911 [Peniophora sp. CONT]